MSEIAVLARDVVPSFIFNRALALANYRWGAREEAGLRNALNELIGLAFPDEVLSGRCSVGMVLFLSNILMVPPAYFLGFRVNMVPILSEEIASSFAPGWNSIYPTPFMGFDHRGERKIDYPGYDSVRSVAVSVTGISCRPVSPGFPSFSAAYLNLVETVGVGNLWSHDVHEVLSLPGVAEVMISDFSSISSIPLPDYIWTFPSSREDSKRIAFIGRVLTSGGSNVDDLFLYCQAPIRNDENMETLAGVRESISSGWMGIFQDVFQNPSF